ncbi:CRISPR-associated endoribonuclease Cas2 [Nitrosomonas stercoris]|uniref:CRISPR-associated endoribonuclease Cas2 n=1 Tax=Nitrosomonas stercoris TaxID=1444684 RepID=A0A4Y1YKH8_9PROT|nr:CRISPR-associated endoribonuclease Cas2 [Nitrosomonas stercoris]
MNFERAFGALLTHLRVLGATSLPAHSRYRASSTMLHMNRNLYLVAYDVCNPRRLYKVCRYLKRYKVGGQKSVFELWITPAELRTIRADLDELLDAQEDRLHILSLDPRMKTRCYGKASTFTAQYFCVV